jgi:hypothetical protein
MKRALVGATTIAIAGLVLGSAAVLGLWAPANTAATNTTAIEPVWTEANWPFPMDQWGLGKAFVCAAADCGAQVNVYVRPKIGFCNCDRGVADDDEVDRVADLDLLSERFAPIAPGDVVGIADMSGRIRAYDLKMSGGLRHAAFGIAVARRCDLLVAVAHGKGEAPEMRRAALDFLATREMTHWVTAAMEGR